MSRWAICAGVVLAVSVLFGATAMNDSNDVDKVVPVPAPGSPPPAPANTTGRWEWAYGYHPKSTEESEKDLPPSGWDSSDTSGGYFTFGWVFIPYGTGWEPGTGTGTPPTQPTQPTEATTPAPVQTVCVDVKCTTLDTVLGSLGDTLDDLLDGLGGLVAGLLKNILHLRLIELRKNELMTKDDELTALVNAVVNFVGCLLVKLGVVVASLVDSPTRINFSLYM